MDDQMAGAVMEGYARLRNDDRVHRLQPGSQERRLIVDEHLVEVAAAHGVEREALAMEIARHLPRSE